MRKQQASSSKNRTSIIHLPSNNLLNVNDGPRSAQRVETKDRILNAMFSKIREAPTPRPSTNSPQEETSNVEKLINSALSKAESEIRKTNDINQRNLIKQFLEKNNNSIKFTKREYFKDESIIIKRNGYEDDIALWLGQVYDKCASTAFNHFTKNNLTYVEAKTYCCEQILRNIIPQLHASKIAEEYKSNKTNKKKNPMRIVCEQSIEILQHLCNKYPQTDATGVNKKLKEMISGMKIDNWDDDNFDLIRRSGVYFKLNEDGVYAQQIMKFLNFLIGLPYQKHRSQNMTNYKYFESVMSSIFEIVYKKDTGSDIDSLLHPDGELSLKIKSKKSLTEEEIQYMEKVRNYTHSLIGSKIAENVHTFTEEEIESGIINIDNSSVARVLDKWADELKKKFDNSESEVLNRVHRFKSASPKEEDKGKQFYKISHENRQNLHRIICEKKQRLEQFVERVKESIYDLSFTLGTSTDSDVSELTFLSENERAIGEFAVKMCEGSSVYFIESLNQQIHLLLESVEELKQQWLSKYKFKQAQDYRFLDISLITFKIGDLMRCKCSSNQEEIIRILNVFKTLSDMWDSKLIKIIRIKDRLDSGTRDILINFMFDEICPCQLQLAVSQSISQKQKYFDKFNHFLYELKRAFLGPVMEMCEIWCHYESKSQTFRKAIRKSTKKKIKKEKISDFVKEMHELDVFDCYSYSFPFVCDSCKIFCPKTSLIFFNSQFKGRYICCYCTKVKVSEFEERKKFHIFNKYLKRYPDFIKLYEKLVEISSYQGFTKNEHEYFISIPINSRNISMRIGKKIQLSSKFEDVDEFVSRSTIFDKNGKLQQIDYKKSVSKKQLAHRPKNIKLVSELNMNINSEYFFYSWSIPTKMMPLPENTINCHICLIEKLIPFINNLQEQEGRDAVTIAALEIEPDFYFYIPYFEIKNKQMNIEEELSFKHNIQKLKQFTNFSKEIIEINDSKLTTEWQQIPIGLRLKISHTVREIYLDNNSLKNIEFISTFQTLKVFYASHNLIETIPKIPQCLTDLFLSNNKIQRISNFSEFNTSLISLDLSQNSFRKLQNLAQLNSLQDLNVRMCQIEKIEGLPPNLFNLNLSHNKIKKIEGFQRLTKIEKLSLVSNEIKVIENLSNCQNLKTLLLNNNQILILQNLEMLKKLENLHFSYVGLNFKMLEVNYKSYQGLRKLKNLKSLSMDGNNIHCLYKIIGISFCSLTNKYEIQPFQEMKSLCLADNKLTNVFDLQRMVPRVTSVDFSKNLIGSIDAFLSLPTLLELNLSNNQILELPTKGWQQWFKIKSVDLSHNFIERVPNLSSLIYIKSLHLQFNKIKAIQSFPLFPIGFPNYERTINLANNLLFDQATSMAQFQITHSALTKLTKFADVDLRENGDDEMKMGVVFQLVFTFVNWKYDNNIK